MEYLSYVYGTIAYVHDLLSPYFSILIGLVFKGHTIFLSILVHVHVIVVKVVM